MEQIGVIIVAGGSGSRMGSSRPKQFLFLDGQPILARTINNFARALSGAQIVVALPKDHMDFWLNLSARFEVAKHTIVEGGAERFYSVRNGMAKLSSDVELIVVHDGVRPLCSDDLIQRTIAAAEQYGAAIPVVEPTNSYRKINDDGSSEGLSRRLLRIVQTPQAFKAEILRKAYQADFKPDFTDDATVVERAGYAIYLCMGECTNIKITTPDELLFAESIIENQSIDDADNIQI